MNPRNHCLLVVFIAFLLSFSTSKTSAQQYRLRQVTSTMSMKIETTVYVKGKRKRTEGGYASLGTNLVTIEQCDLQRNIVLNDKKKLYFIEPFSNGAMRNAGEDEKTKAKPAVATGTNDPKSGGTITFWSNITDTGERKKIYGITARHVWTTQKIVPSADACMMKDSMTIKTDGWYIDLPEFTCAVNNGGQGFGAGYEKADCKDRYIVKQTGKGKLGFPLIEKRTMIMGDGKAESSQFVTDLETLEFSTAKLDSLLFEIPNGYTLVQSRQELQDKLDMNSTKAAYENMAKEGEGKKINAADPKPAGVLRIGVYEPQINEDVQRAALRTHLVNTLTSGKIEAVAVQSAEEAKRLQCDLVLSTQFSQVKKATKIGGLLKAIKNSDPSASSSYTIEARLLVTNLADGSTRTEQNVAGKFEGSAEEASKKALDEGAKMILKKIN